jgi:hypothetical protein
MGVLTFCKYACQPSAGRRSRCFPQMRHILAERSCLMTYSHVPQPCCGLAAFDPAQLVRPLAAFALSCFRTLRYGGVASYGNSSRARLLSTQRRTSGTRERKPKSGAPLRDRTTRNSGAVLRTDKPGNFRVLRRKLREPEWPAQRQPIDSLTQRSILASCSYSC